MISRILIDYLSNSRRVVLPDFGAFIRKDTDGKVIFVEYLKRDDNVLSGMIAKAANLPEARAKSMISAYVSDIRRKVKTDGMYIIEGLGKIYIDSDGLYQLDYDPAALYDSVPAAVAVPAAPSPVQSPQQTVQRPAQQPARQIREDELPAQRVQPPVQQQTPRPLPSAPQPAEQAAPAPKPVPEQPLRPATESSKEENGLQEERIRMEHSDVKNLRYRKPQHKPMNPNVSLSNKKRADKVMLIAIISAAAAILVMIYALFSTSKPRVEVKLEDIPAIVNDSIN